ncbi:hypothetical protein [Methylobacterium gnaphalii]|uniref:SpoVG family protein n=1 Tax=Methylobacterium gnaphalii TaxID=1010610 RepID=A0A512JH39_9HYPH|nr:hypothetical protein [Methylobacterium gnaphalii]GEP09271.1 hypothetical protein MGN01_11160 [Methylobacterium gnaphalii]GJD69052.1 hypothetical protein MMMDOFMJ_1978 [Methylobacterium gnaphalii]GLS50996.1 hypothetical protein GCM10007885_38500 [Methylobacterium gnaphalii]
MADGQPIPVRVLGLRIAKRALNGNSDSGLVCTFDIAVPGFTLFAAGLYRRRDGKMMVVPPRSERHDGIATGMRIDSEPLRDAMLNAAREAARAFGASVDPVPAEA